MEDGAVEDYGDALDEDDEGIPEQVGVITYVVASQTKEVEEAHQYIKDISILLHMLKHPYFITKIFKDNKKVKDHILKNMCSFGEWADWSSRIIPISSHLDVETRKDQYFLLNTTPLDWITG